MNGIDKSLTSEGVLLVSLDANTETFLDKVNKSSGVTATFAIIGGLSGIASLIFSILNYTK